MASVLRLNHAVLYVRDAAVSAEFYQRLLGFEVVSDLGPGQAVFLKAQGSANHHDLGLFSRGQGGVAAPRGSVGLYHLAWQVDTLNELVEIRSALMSAGALVGESDHGASKSLYAKDPDGIEFEVAWLVPREAWGDTEMTAPLQLAGELDRWAGVATGSEPVQRLG